MIKQTIELVTDKFKAVTGIIHGYDGKVIIFDCGGIFIKGRIYTRVALSFESKEEDVVYEEWFIREHLSFYCGYLFDELDDWESEYIIGCKEVDSELLDNIVKEVKKAFVEARL